MFDEKCSQNSIISNMRKRHAASSSPDHPMFPAEPAFGIENGGLLPAASSYRSFLIGGTHPRCRTQLFVVLPAHGAKLFQCLRQHIDNALHRRGALCTEHAHAVCRTNQKTHRLHRYARACASREGKILAHLHTGACIFSAASHKAK